MQKRTQKKTTLRKITAREIKQTFGRFFAIFAIIALGVGFFGGLHATTPVLIRSVDAFCQDLQLYDYRMVSTIGWEESEVEKIRARKGVRDVEGAWQYDVLCENGNGETAVYRVHSLTEKVNGIRLDEGRYPENASECIMDAKNRMGLSIGDKIRFSSDNEEDTLDAISEHTLTITGFADAALYINFERGTSSVGNGTVTGFLYLPREAFTEDYYTEIYVKLDSDDEILSDSYVAQMDDQRDEWESEEETLADDRYDRVKEDAESELADAKEEFETQKADGEKELADARKELDDAEQELADAEQELADAKQELADGEQELADAREELADGKKELDDARDELADGYDQLKSAERELSDAKKELDKAADTLGKSAKTLNENAEKLTAAKEELDKSYKELAAGHDAIVENEKTLAESFKTLSENKAALDAGYAELAEKEAQLDAAEAYGLIDAETLAASRAELAAGKAQLDAGAAAYEEGLAQYNAGKAQFDQAKAEYEAGVKQYNAGKEEYESGLAQYEEGLKQYNAGLEEYNKGKAKYEAGLAEYKKAKKKYEDGVASYNDGLAEYEEGVAEYNDGVSELEDGWQEYYDGLKEYEDGKKEYEDGLQEYDDGKKEFDEEIADAQEKIDDAEEKIRDLKRPDTWLLERNANMAYACFESDSQIVRNVAVVFPFFFILVAILVCMTTMTRMVEEQRGQIGTLKGLGYTDADIMKGFMMYSGTASVLGSVIGYAAGVIAFPAVIWAAYQMMYTPMQVRFVFEWKVMLATMAAALACSFGATYAACRSALKESAASLMRPRAPKAGKRIFLEYIPAVWSRMKFMHKVSARNIFRYKKRFFMMVLGIGGCMALLLTGFGLKDSITGFAEMQFDRIEVADAKTVFRNGHGEEMPAEIAEAIGEIGATAYLYEQSSWDAVLPSRLKSVDVIATMSEGSLEPFFTLRSMDGGPVSLPEQGKCIICVSLASRYGVEIGDELTLRNGDMKEMTLTVEDVFENHVYEYVFVTPEDVRQAAGECDVNGAYVNFPEDSDVYAAQTALAKCEDMTNVTILMDLRNRLTDMLSSMNYIVLLVIISAAALAFVVLYNLTNINIIERIREIATIKVLGFYPRETSDYIFRENMVLTVFGAFIGIFLGIALHRFVMSKIVVDMVYFPIKISRKSYLYSILLTFGFTVFVNLVMSGKLEKVNMAESLKSVE